MRANYTPAATYYRNGVQAILDKLNNQRANTALDFETIICDAEHALEELLERAPIVDTDAAKRLQLSGRHQALDTIVATVAARFDVTPEEIRGQSRTAHLCHARHIAMFVASACSTMAVTELGAYFGDRDHSTILHGVRKISTWIDAGRFGIIDELKLIGEQLERGQRDALAFAVRRATHAAA